MNINFDIRPDGGVVQTCKDPGEQCQPFDIVFKSMSFEERKAFQQRQMHHGSLATRLAAAQKKMDAGFDGSANDYDNRIDRLRDEINQIHEEMIPATTEIADAAVEAIIAFPNGFKINGEPAEYTTTIRDALIAQVPGFLQALITGFSDLNGLTVRSADEPDSGNSRTAPKSGRKRR